jgi:hypothetical protein
MKPSALGCDRALQVGGFSNLRQLNVVMSPAGLGSVNDCAGEDRQQLQTTDPYSPQRGCYIRTLTSKVQLENKITGRESQGAVAKTN